MSPAEIALAGHNFLAKVLQEAYELTNGRENLRDAFIFRHARNVGDIADDVFFLYNSDRYIVPALAARPMLESLYCAAAALHNPTFAAEKIIAECDDFFTRLERAERLHGITGLVSLGQRYKDTADRLRKEHNID